MIIFKIISIIVSFISILTFLCEVNYIRLGLEFNFLGLESGPVFFRMLVPGESPAGSATLAEIETVWAVQPLSDGFTVYRQRNLQYA